MLDKLFSQKFVKTVVVAPLAVIVAKVSLSANPSILVIPVKTCVPLALFNAIAVVPKKKLLVV